MSDSLVKQWSSFFVPNDKEATASFMSTATGEDAMYEEYRDELDDFVTVKN